MNMGSLRTELEMPAMMYGQPKDHFSGDQDLDDDVMILGSTPKVHKHTS